MARELPPIGTQTCHVVPAAAIVARLGANMGDGLDADAPLEPGDVYVLSRGVKPGRLVTRDGKPARVTAGSEVGAVGEAVSAALSLILIALNGDVATVTLLRFETGAVMALVDGTLEPEVEYTLVSANAPRDDVALTDIVPFGLGRGTRVLAGNGTPRPVESLRPGDLVFTRDSGPQPLRDVVRVTLRAQGPQAPVMVPAAMIGNSSDLVLSRDQRLHLYLRTSNGAHHGPEVLARAFDLIGTTCAFVQSGGVWTCHGLVFDRHEIVYAECIAVESLPLSEASIARLPREARADLVPRLAGFRQPMLPVPEAPTDMACSLLAARAGHVARTAPHGAPHQSG